MVSVGLFMDPTDYEEFTVKTTLNYCQLHFDGMAWLSHFRLGGGPAPCWATRRNEQPDADTIGIVRVCWGSRLMTKE